MSRCISGDSYLKGTYFIKAGKLKLIFDRKYVDEITDEEYDVTKLEIKEKDLKPSEFDVTRCGQKIRLAHPTIPEWRNGGRYEAKREAELMKQLKTSEAFKTLIK